MNEDGSVELLRHAPDRLKRSIIEIQSVDASGVRICVDVRANLCPAQSQLTNATFQLFSRQIRILKRDRRQASESFPVVPDYAGDVIIQPPRKIKCIVRFRPITEH